MTSLRSAFAESGKRRGKKLVVCCDGTWMNADNGYVKDNPWWPWSSGHLQVPSNVTRIARSILPYHKDGRNQIVYYQAGVGTGMFAMDKILGGATGEGLSENIREAYAFVAHNYQEANEKNEGDEIFLIGFSRGAFTARSIAGLIECIGVLTKLGMGHFYEIFKDYEKSGDHNWAVEYQKRSLDRPFANRPNIRDPAYGKGLEERHLSRVTGVKVKAIAVWDTVGSLGIPRISWLDCLFFASALNREYSFHNTKLSNSIEHAFQALALDEMRPPFAPAVWEKPDNVNTELVQVWFPGVHCNVGGGNDDQELADITLAWMMSKLEPFLSFNTTYLELQYKSTKDYEMKQYRQERSWGLGFIQNSSTGLMRISGKSVRTPGRYCLANRKAGLTTTPLENTNEYIHASVRVRLGLKGAKGIDDKGRYKCEALDGWILEGVDIDGDGVIDGSSAGNLGQTEISWRHKDPDVPRLKEEVLGDLEKELLFHFDDMATKVMKIIPTDRVRKRGDSDDDE
ncbi:hypothetical protein FGG08_003584 [Glutinoglossum americanum]|uniref:T6SS Phospholipase effector Tle1-like catalytic domain-containing protein n=1 Tax=Glutinoglossum americanum TaxID=1670608 RepID=A0A9P8I9A2_9PEZI|nr:hypothetical protein FGG08_003584 [Glutinoglossum americanum]